MPLTRKTKASTMAQGPLSEAELEILNQKTTDSLAQLQQERETLRRQREEFETERANSMREMSTRQERLLEKEREYKSWAESCKEQQQDEDHAPRNDSFPETRPIQHDMDQTRQTHPPSFFPTGHHGYARYGQPPNADPLYEYIPGPKISYREATESVPIFDGYNIPLSQFIRACRRAKEVVPASSERNLTQLLINKLRGRAVGAVEDEPCDSITQLIDLLTGAFGSPKTINQYRGELSGIYMRPYEHILDYIRRVKDLRMAILDTEHGTNGRLDPHFVADIDSLTIFSFIEGLPFDYRLQIQPEDYNLPSEAFARAKAIAKRMELYRQRDDPRLLSEYKTDRTPTKRYPVNPIGSPLAHSTPQRGGENEYRWNQGTPSYRPNPQRDNRSPPIRTYRESSGPRTYNVPNNNRQQPSTERREVNREIVCRYCKNPGHEIEECRKRQYNNARKNEAENSRGPPGRTSAPRWDEQKKTRPVNPIIVELAENETDEENPGSESRC